MMTLERNAMDRLHRHCPPGPPVAVQRGDEANQTGFCHGGVRSTSGIRSVLRSELESSS